MTLGGEEIYFYALNLLFTFAIYMLQTDVKKIDFQWKNTLKSYCVNLDSELDCIIVFSTKDDRLADLLYTKILDAIIDRIHPKNAYKDFSGALENINGFLHSWKHEDGKIKGLSAAICIYNKKTFLFSTVWKASLLLHNTHKELIEITDKDDNPKDFSFISSGDIASGEVVMISTMRLLDVLSRDDIKDGLSSWNIIRSWDNIESILFHEYEGKNVALVSCKKEIEVPKSSKWDSEKLSYYFYRACDNAVIKKILSYVYHLKDKLIDQSQKVKQISLWVWLIVSTFLLYYIISGFFHIASLSSSTENYKQELLFAQGNIVTASENMNNEDVFSLNIDEAKEIITTLEAKELFLWDVKLLRDRISLLQQQFNGIQPFSVNDSNTIYNFESGQEDIVKVLSISNKIYVVHKDAITWPIFQWQEAKRVEFSDLWADDFFIDATVWWDNIIVTTKKGRVVNYAKNNFFSYADVLNQPKWENSPIISAYASNIYMLSDSQNQILAHKRQWVAYTQGVSYLRDEDSIDIWRILSLAIDWGIYILKLDGSIVKFFRSPEYRLESLLINKLPKNYNFDSIDSENLPSLRARTDLSYVYMLLDNKIFVFKPNTRNYRDVKSLNYLWQIEGKDIVIQDFYADNDGELFVASEQWVYKLEFDVNNDELLVR